MSDLQDHILHELRRVVDRLDKIDKRMEIAADARSYQLGLIAELRVSDESQEKCLVDHDRRLNNIEQHTTNGHALTGED